MVRITLRSLLSRKLRLLLSGFAVVLGVTFVAGAMALTETISRSFERGMASAYDVIDVVVSGEQLPTSPAGSLPTAPVPAELVEELAALPAVGEVLPEVYTEGVRPLDHGGQPISTFSTHVGSNWVPGSGLVELRAGQQPRSPDEVAINAELARIGAFDVGDTIEVVTVEPAREFTIVGIFGITGERDSWFGETQVAFTTPVAQELLLGERDLYTEVGLTAADGATAQELHEQVTATTGERAVVMAGDELLAAIGDDIREELGFLDDIFLGFAFVALLVGAFLVLNTFSIVVAQRMRELALLRAIGAGRRQIVGSVLVEAVALGAVAATVGLGLGVAVAYGLTAWLGSQLQMAPALAVPARAVVGAYGTGIVVTVLAALVPAIRASRIAPVAAMRGAQVTEQPLSRLSIVGGGFASVGLVLLLAGLIGDLSSTSIAMALGGSILAFVGVVLLTPLLVRPLTAILGAVFARSVPGDLGRRNTARQPRRTAITASALMVGVTLVTLASTFFGSFAASYAEVFEADLDAQLVITSEPTELARPTFDRAVVDDLRDLDEVEAAAAIWEAQVEIGDDMVTVSVVDGLPEWFAMAGIDVLDGDTRDLARGEVAISEHIADRQELAVGDYVTITTFRGGERPYEVALVHERSDLVELPLLSTQDVADLGLHHPHEAFLGLHDDADVAAVRAAVQEHLEGTPAMVVHDRSGYVEQQTRQFDQAIVFVQVLLLLAMVIAVLGVVNTLVLSITERTRELGLLRAIGLGRVATARMVGVESVLMSVLGALLGVVTGAGLGAAVVTVLRDEGFSELVLPWGLIVTYVVAAAILGAAASVLPAIRAARLDVMQAIATE